MNEATGASDDPAPRVREFSNAMTNFEVLDRDGEIIGRVHDVNFKRTCIIVETPRSGLFGRKRQRSVHVWAARDVDVDAFTISLATTKEDVVEAPDVFGFSDETETLLAHYYYERLSALSEKAFADDRQAPAD